MSKNGSRKHHDLVGLPYTMHKIKFSIDNSEWMRNGDLPPTRLQCEQEAAHLIMQCKLRSNPENAVGLLTMAEYIFEYKFMFNFQ